jgi:hypothetical protein
MLTITIRLSKSHIALHWGEMPFDFVQVVRVQNMHRCLYSDYEDIPEIGVRAHYKELSFLGVGLAKGWHEDRVAA